MRVLEIIVKEAMMKFKSALVLAAMLAASPASAGCVLSIDPCSTDSQGNTYTERENLGGGTNVYRNGSLYSQTQQNLSGGYTEKYQSGGARYYDEDPYAPPKRRNSLLLYEE